MWTRLLYRFFGFNSNASLTYVSSSTMYFLVFMTMIIIMIHESCSAVHNHWWSWSLQWCDDDKISANLHGCRFDVLMACQLLFIIYLLHNNICNLFYTTYFPFLDFFSVNLTFVGNSHRFHHISPHTDETITFGGGVAKTEGNVFLTFASHPYMPI